jgi:hypothetical protein
MITRRKLLVGAAATVAAAAGGAGLYHGRDLVAWLRRVATPALPQAPPGPLPPPVLSTLLAAVEALLATAPGPPAARDPRPYADLLRSRAESVAGYRELYRRFAAAVDRRAAGTGAPSFAAAPLEQRRRFLAELCPPGRLARLRLGWSDPDRARFRLHVVQEILGLYAATGAWLALGYAAYPGQARGLDAYTGPPGSAP